jgi:hypothetical protein
LFRCARFDRRCVQQKAISFSNLGEKTFPPGRIIAAGWNNQGGNRLTGPPP